MGHGLLTPKINKKLSLLKWFFHITVAYCCVLGSGRECNFWMGVTCRVEGQKQVHSPALAAVLEATLLKRAEEGLVRGMRGRAGRKSLNIQ